MTKFMIENPSEHTAYSREWAKTDKGIAYRKRHAEYMREYRRKHGAHISIIKKESMVKSRKEALEHYGVDGVAMCHCCGETRYEFLQLDHKNNDGNVHRAAMKKELGYTYTNMFYWAKKNGWPDMFQTLCANCNLAKHFYHGCPHVTEKANLTE